LGHLTPKKSNAFQAHPCKGERQTWKTPTLADSTVGVLNGIHSAPKEL